MLFLFRLCAYWVTPMCHARRPNATISKVFSSVCFEVISFIPFFFLSLFRAIKYVQTVGCRYFWLAPSNNGKLIVCIFSLPSVLFVVVVVVFLLHVIVIHASKLLFWVEIFNFHLKLAHFAHHVFLRPTLNNIWYFMELLFIKKSVERRNDLCVECRFKHKHDQNNFHVFISHLERLFRFFIFFFILKMNTIIPAKKREVGGRKKRNIAPNNGMNKFPTINKCIKKAIKCK